MSSETTPTCHKCTKKYYESPLELVDRKIQCINCNYTFKKNRLKEYYIWLNASYGFNMLNLPDRIITYLMLFIIYFSLCVEATKGLMKIKNGLRCWSEYD